MEVKQTFRSSPPFDLSDLFFRSADKDFIKRAYRLAIDAHRTVLPLSYPPHTIAAACLYLTSFLTTDADESGVPPFDDGWAESVQCLQDDIEGKH